MSKKSSVRRGILAILFASVLIVIQSCQKSEIRPSFSRNQVLMMEKFKTFTNNFGEVDLESVKFANNGNEKLFIITSKVKGSETKKYVLFVDNRNVTPHFARFIFETNIPGKELISTEASGYRFAQFVSLEQDRSLFKVEFQNGNILNFIKPIPRDGIGYSGLATSVNEYDPSLYVGQIGELTLGDDESYAMQAESELQAMIASTLTDCIKREMRKMTFGGWCLFIATEPESVAALVLACAIDTIVYNH